jgi:hypothetical protein
MDQRVEEVHSQADADEQSDDGFDHELNSSQSVASERVCAHQDEKQHPNGEIDGVSHSANLQCEAAFCARCPQAINVAMGVAP